MSKPSSAILPPQKVIRALTTYKSQAPQELSFHKGDFFYVLRDGQDSAWYEAHNPVTGSRGIVPRAMFEEFGKNITSVRNSQFSTPGGGYKSPVSPGAGSLPSPSLPKHQVYYAVVMHDFNAERPDELEAKRGDAVTVVAQSNREWFVAKPIGKLGRPGLIPVSFVEIHDPSTGKPVTDIDALIDRGDLPKVEEWKRAMLTYKQNSISLGVIDPPTRGSIHNSPFALQPSPLPPSPPSPEPRDTPYDCLPEGILLSADVVSFHFEMDEYWFRVDAVFQPYGPPGQALPPAKQLILFRVYEDFYEFQVTLLNTFPKEAGRQPGHSRTLPYMPGPSKEVDDKLTATRREELDDYIHGLCALAKTGGQHILEHAVLRQFLALKPGDVEQTYESRKSQDADVEQPDSNPVYNPQDYVPEVAVQVARMRVQDNDQNSDGSDYEDEGYAHSPQHRPQHPYGQYAAGNPKHLSRDDSLRLQAHEQNHQRSDSTASFHTPSYPSHSRSQSNERMSPIPPRTGEYSNGQSRWNEQQSREPLPSTASFRSSQSASSRSRSQSTATNPNNPPISAANPQTAFVKIKIFDRVADDLIAIRVHPKVSHSELMEKVQARLGSELRVLKYRDSLTNTFVGLDTDAELRAWMDGTDKHVLYAD
ncbi:scd2/ral3 [Coprinopsis marcescibilis]|uniref:Scd2/ral3 n=1 Tax=Coprinopsis marcescibilis TaxID=230819 RepID=A0A5C3L8W7_COPMA|nr:scd2/ral3 [Coprinopsis marcescibilis]